MVRRRTTIRHLLLVLAILYLLGTIFGGIGLGWIALHPPSAKVTPHEEANAQMAAAAASEGFSDATLTTQDGSTLRAWLLARDRQMGMPSFSCTGSPTIALGCMV